MSYDTHLLDQAVCRRRQQLEHERRQTLTAVRRFLDQFGSKYGIEQAVIFGSVVRPGRFHERSDVDIAVTDMEADDFFDLMASLSLALVREVDLVDLARCHFAGRIRETGEKWTRKG